MANPIQGLKIDTNILNVKKDFDNLINYINDKTKKPFEINFNLNGVQQQVDKINSEFQKLNINNNLEKQFSSLMDKNTVTAKEDLVKIKGSVDEVLAEFQKLGNAKILPQNFDKNGQLVSFVVQLEEIEGLYDKITYKAKEFESLSNGKLKPVSYSATGITENNKTSQVAEENDKKLQNDINQIEERRLQMIKDREAEELKYNQILEQGIQQNKLDNYNNQKKKELEQYETEFKQLLEQEKLETQEYEKQFKALVEKEKQEQKIYEQEFKQLELVDDLANQMANGKNQANNLRVIEEQNQAYSEALNLLKEEYLLIQQITKAENLGQLGLVNLRTGQLGEVNNNLTSVTSNLTEEQRVELSRIENGLIENQIALDTKIQDRQNIQNQNIEKQIALYKQMAEIKLQNLQSSNNSALKDTGIQEQITQYKNALASLNTTNFNASNLDAQFAQLKANIKSIGVEATSSQGVVSKFFGQMAHDIGAMATWMVSGTAIFGTFNAIKDGIKDVIDLDNTLANLKITMNGTEEQFKDMASAIQQTAIQTGSSVEAVSEAARTYANAMETTESIMAKTKSAIMLGNVTGLNSKEVTDSIHAIINEFNLAGGNVEETSNHIADSLVAISKNMAMDFGDGVDEISKGIQRVGTVATETAKLSSDETEAILGAIIERTRLSGETVANGMKTIIARIYQSNSIDPDVTDEDMSKMSNMLDKLGISVRDTSGQFKPLNDLLDEMKTHMDGMSDSQKQAVLIQGAGVRQANILLSALETVDKAQLLNNAALSSNGELMKANSVYMDTISAKWKTLGSIMTTSFQQGINADIIKGLLDGVTKLVEIFGNLGTIISLVATGFAVFKGVAILEFFTTLPTRIMTSVRSLEVYKVAVGAMELQEAGLITQNEVLSLSFTALGNSIKTAFLSNPLGWIALGVSTVVGLIDVVDSKTEQLSQDVEKLNQDFSQFKNVDNLVEQKKALDDLSKTTSLTADQKNKLKDIEANIAQVLPKATTAYDENNRALATNLEIVKKLNAEEKERVKTEALKVVNASKNKAENAYSNIDIAETYVKKIEDQLANPNNQRIQTNTKEFMDRNSALKRIQDMRESLLQYKDTISQYNDSAKILNEELNLGLPIYGDYTQAINKNTQATDGNTDAKDKNTNSTDNQNKSLSDLQTAFATATEKGLAYDKILVELDKDHTLSASTIKELVKSYPELIQYLGNEAGMRQKLTELINQQKDTERQAYIDMEKASYNAMTQDEKNKVDATNAKLAVDKQYYQNTVLTNTDFVNHCKTAYGVDLSNFKDLASAKAAVDKALISRLNQAWADYDNAVSSVMQTHEDLVKRMSADDGFSTDSAIADHLLQRLVDVNKAASQAKSNANSIQSAINGLSTDFSSVGINFTSLNNSDAGADIKAAAKSAEDAAKDYANALKTAQDKANQDLLSLQSKLVSAKKALYEEDKTNAINALNAEKDAAIKALQAQEKATEDYYTGKIKQLQDEINALQNTKSDDEAKLTNLKKELVSWSKDDSQYGKSQVVSIQKQIDDLTKQLTIADKENQIKQLQDEETAKKDSYSKQENDLNTSYQKREDDTNAYYNNLLKDANLYAESNKLIMSNNQQEIINLLTAYAPEYSNVGQILGKSLSQTMLSEIQNGLSGLQQIQSGKYNVILDNGSTSSASVSSGSSSSSSSSGSSGNSSSPSSSSSGSIAWDGKYYKQGSTGDVVKRIQQNLNANGYNLAVDGIFGTNTASALRDYQSKNGLSADAIVGNQTWSKLIKFHEGGTPVDFMKSDEGLSIVKKGESILKPIDTSNILKVVNMSNDILQNLIPKINISTPKFESIKQQPIQVIYNAPLVQNDIEQHNASQFDLNNGFDNISRLIKNDLLNKGFGITQLGTN